MERKPLIFVGSSLNDLKKMPEDVQDVIGYSLDLVQQEKTPSNAKPLKGLESGIYEIRCNYDKDTYRAVYAVKIKGRVFVLHSFKKKSKSGIATPKKEMDLIKQRYKQALEFKE